MRRRSQFLPGALLALMLAAVFWGTPAWATREASPHGTLAQPAIADILAPARVDAIDVDRGGDPDAMTSTPNSADLDNDGDADVAAGGTPIGRPFDRRGRVAAWPNELQNQPIPPP